MARPKEEDTKLVRLPEGMRSLIAHRDAYKYATGDVCEALRCSREFCSAHVRTQVEHIYVDTKSAYIAWEDAGTRAYKGGLIYSTEGLDAMISNSTVERRTRAVWPSTMLRGHEDALAKVIEHADAQLASLGRAYEEEMAEHGMRLADADAIRDMLNKGARGSENPALYEKALDKLQGDEDAVHAAIGASWLDRSDQVGVIKLETKELVDDLVEKLSPAWYAVIEASKKEGPTKRGDAPWCSIGDRQPTSWAQFAAGGWRTARCLTDWGETTEMTWRHLWKESFVRLTIAFEDGATRQLFAPDPTAERAGSGAEARVCDPYVLPVHRLPDDYIDGMRAR